MVDSATSYLLISVYMPTDYGASSVSDFLHTLELEGFIDTQCCDVAMVVGDFNVDFELDLSVCDLSFRDKVKFTYERDDGACHSWIDHVLCSQSHSSLITDVFARHSDCCLSDHYPLCCSLDFNSSPLPGPSYSLHIDWQNVSNCDIDKYISLVSQGISTFPSDVYNCISPGCTLHCDTLDLYADHLVSTLLTCALDSFPTRSVSSSRRLVGWNRSLSKHKNATNFWYKIWEEAGCPYAGALFQIKRNAKRRYKYEVRRLVREQNYLLQNKLATSFAEKRKNSFWTHVRKLNSSSSTLAPTIDGVSGSRNIANVFASELKDTLNTLLPPFICIPQLN